MPASYRAMISSDWNGCLAPCDPFDAIVFSYPSLKRELTAVFHRYTGNEIRLGEAADIIASLLPSALTEDQMDAYLDTTFETYPGVSSLIEWASRNRVLFMIDTTGMIGYFQRVFARGRLPRVPVLAAHPLVRYPARPTDPSRVFDLTEIEEKATHTEAVARRFSIPFSRVAVVGDSGGDGPHFAWAAENGAVRIGSMTKSSLSGFCRRNCIDISYRIGPSYPQGQIRNLNEERAVDFRELIPFLEKTLSL